MPEQPLHVATQRRLLRDFIGALPVNSVIHAAGLSINTSTIKALRRPVESSQFASWVFSQKVTDAGLAPSVGAVGAPFDNAMVEAFWPRMQVELLNRQRWKTASSSPTRSTTTSRHGTTPDDATAP